MSIDSNRCQLFYCSSTALTPQVQRPATRQKCFNQEAKTAVDSPAGVTPPPTPSPPSSYPPPPLLLIRPLPNQQLKSNLPPQALSSIPISSPSLGNGQGKMINITITRKRLKVTSGNGEFPVSILKPLANVLRSAGGKIKKVDGITVRTPIPPIIPIRPLPKNNCQQIQSLQQQSNFQLPKSSSSSKIQFQSNCQKKHQPLAPQPPSQSQPQSSFQQHHHPNPQTQTQTQTQAVVMVNNPIMITTPNLESNEPSTVQVSPSKIPSTPPEAPEIIELCPYCGNYFYTYKTYSCHLMTVHYSTLIRNVSTCATCGIVHVDYGSYVNHCLQAHSIYPTGTELEDPITIASPVNPLYRKCNICNVTFPSTRAIQAHFYSHLGPSVAYTCRLCRRHVPTFYSLAVHLGTVHSIHFRFSSQSNPQSNQQSNPQLQSQYQPQPQPALQCPPQAQFQAAPRVQPQAAPQSPPESHSQSTHEKSVEGSSESRSQSVSGTSTECPTNCPPHSQSPISPLLPVYSTSEGTSYDSQC